MTKSRSLKKDCKVQHGVISFKCITIQEQDTHYLYEKKEDNDDNDDDNDDEKKEEKKSYETLSEPKKIENGMIGVYITETFAFRAAKFWNDNITLSFNTTQFREAATLFLVI